jgi:hypothetical protein
MALWCHCPSGSWGDASSQLVVEQLRFEPSAPPSPIGIEEKENEEKRPSLTWWRRVTLELLPTATGGDDEATRAARHQRGWNKFKLTGLAMC